MAYGQVAKGTTLGYCATSNGSYTTVDGVKDVKTPEISLVTTDRTALGDAWQVKGAAHINVGQLTVQFYYDKTKLETFHDMMEGQVAGAVNYWKVTTPDGTTVMGAGFLAKQSFGTYTVGEEVMFDVTIEASGEWDVTPSV